MNEQISMKRYGESTTQCLKAIEVGQWIGERVRRVRGMLVFAKRPVAPIRARTA